MELQTERSKTKTQAAQENQALETNPGGQQERSVLTCGGPLPLLPPDELALVFQGDSGLARAKSWGAWVTAIGVVSVACLVHAQPAAFTYQGRLDNGANPANGSYDLRFTLFDAPTGGSSSAGPLTNLATTVSDGLFAVALDFGAAAFSGADRWLEIGVRTNGSAAFNLLSPRVRLNPTPYAIHSASASSLPPGAITSAMLGNNAVTADKIAPGAVSQLGSPTGSPANALTVGTNGLVGIGTSNPAAALTIAAGGSNLVPTILYESWKQVSGLSNYVARMAVEGDLAALAGFMDSTVSFFSMAGGNPIMLSQLKDGVGGFNNLGGTYGVALRGDIAIVAGSADNTVSLVSITNPSNPVLLAELKNGSGGWSNLSVPDDVAVNGNLLAISAYADNAVSLVDIANPSAPQLRAVIKDGVAGITDLKGPETLCLAGNLLVVASTLDNSVSLFDVSNPSAPSRLSVLKDGFGGFNKLQTPSDLAIQGNLLAIAADVDGEVSLVDISNPAQPVLRSLVSEHVPRWPDLSVGAITRVAFNGNWLAISTLPSIVFMDTLNPAAPRWLHTMEMGVDPVDSYELAFVHDDLIAGVGYQGFRLLHLGQQPVSLVSDHWVGIGTPNPVAPLHVVGSVVIEAAEVLDVRAKAIHLEGATIELGDSADAGSFAAAIGYHAAASGEQSCAIGSGSQATGDFSLAVGASAKASGVGSTALGYQTVSSNDFATAVGYRTLASGVYATALGNSTRALGGNSFAAGYDTEAIGFTATALGLSSTASGQGTTATGIRSVASGLSSTATGFENSAIGDYSFAAGRNARANHPRSFVWSSYPAPSPSFAADTFFINAPDGLGMNCGSQRPDGGGQYWMNLGRVASGGQLIETSVGAALSLSGVWQNASDQSRKTGFEDVNPQEILEKVAALPVRQWRYTNEVVGIRHLGPTAQDFKAAFGLGESTTTIGTLDADGVALAAIQGLNQKLEETRAENAELKQRLERLERLFNQQNGGAR